MKKNIYLLGLVSFLVLIFLVYSHVALFKGEFFDSHDSVFHLVRTKEMYQAVKAGQIPARWAPGLVNGLGVPVFNYFYPLFYYLSAPFLALGLTAAMANKILIVLASIGGLFFAQRFLDNFFDFIPSLVGAFFFVFAPYMFLNIYVRGNFTEYLAFMMLPMVFWALNQIITTKKLFWPTLILGTFILSHNIIAMLATGWIVFYGLFYFFIFLKNSQFNFKAFWRSNKQKGIKVLLFFILSLGISSFFWLPALTEIPYTYLAEEKVYSWANHFPTIEQLIYSPWRYGSSLPGPGDYMSFQIGPIHLLLAGISGFLFLKNFFKKRVLENSEYFYLFFLTSGFIIVFLMNHRSTFLWRALPFLERVQFPWRLLGFLLFALSFLIAHGFQELLTYFDNKILLKLVFILATFALAFRFYHNYPRPKIYHRVANLLNSQRARGSTATNNELLPINVPLTKDPLNIKINDTVSCEAFSCQKNLNLEKQQEIVFGKFYFPTWQGKINGQETKLKPDKRGLISIIVPAGNNNIKIYFEQTRLEKMVNLISVVSFIILLIISKLFYEKNRQ